MRYIPNAFQVANAFVDEMLAELSGSAIKCYLKIVRQTTGWGKEVDYIPIAQFQEACGLKKRDTVGQALNELEQAGLIERVERLGCVTGYRLKGVEPTPKNGAATHPENGGKPDKRGNPENGGGVTPINGVPTHPEKRGTSKPNSKPTNTKPKYIGACAPDESPDPQKNPAAGTEKFQDAYRLLADKGVDGQTAADYMTLRRSKRAGPLTPTALAGLEREAALAGLTLPQVITACCERGWVGFKADWLRRENSINVPRHTKGGVYLAKDLF